jgi:nitrite reductase/ring-hydroxylating ferredoxin subunit
MSDGFTSTVLLEDLEINRPLRVTTDNGSAVLVRLSDDEVVAFAAICPHAMGDLSRGELVNGEIECPMHGWRFDVRSGACVFPPDAQRMRTFPTRIIDGAVWVKIEKPKWMAED